jgi:hypothetical protein
VRNTADHKLWLQPSTDVDPTLYVDASFAPTVTVSASPNGDSKPDAHSRTGMAFFWRGSLLQWKHSKQRIVANSSSAAELIALEAGLGYGLGLMEKIRHLYKEMKWILPKPLSLRVLEDNQPVIDSVQAKFAQRLRHYAIKVARVKELIATGEISLEKVAGVSQLADGLSKIIKDFPFEKFRMSGDVLNLP